MEKGKQRDKLIELIVNAKRADPETKSFTEFLADFLLGYGVFVPDDGYGIDRLRELVEADKAGRCFMSDLELGGEVFYIPKFNGKPYCGVQSGHVQAVTFTKAGKRVKIREHHAHNQDFMLGKSVFLTREAAESALAKEEP